MGILQVPIFKYNEWCRTTAANLAPRGTTALHTEAPRILLLYACVVPLASSHDGTKQTRYTGVHWFPSVGWQVSSYSVL